jgi:hypothetical protein
MPSFAASDTQRLMTTSYDYDRRYDPAAPVIPIGLGPSGTETVRREVLALVDTGSDASMFPIDILKKAGARYVEQYMMRPVVGEPVEISLYVTAVHVAGYAIHGIRAIAQPAGSEALIGRDVLNELDITLKGLAQEIWIA